MSFPTIAESIETITGISHTTTLQMERIHKQVNELVLMSEELLGNVNIYKVIEAESITQAEQTRNLLIE